MAMLSLTAVKFVLLVLRSAFKSVDPVGYEILSFDRYLEMRKHLDDMVGERLAARERVALASYSQLVRPL